MTVKESKIPHPDDGLGLLAFRITRKSEVVGYYFGFLANANVIKEQPKTEMYGEGGMQVTAKTSWKCINELSEKATDHDGTDHRL